ncbi:ubiquinone/menaquinone biosynthesis C-methyltransferase UbiE [Clostridiales bacterium]|nr:ubiquinone/menaquinone biosynthesis C-methyltransferase UbiE [Clostridiales bacterium]
MTDTDNKSFWNKWAKRYDTAMSADRKNYDRLIIQIKKCLTRNMTVLELACGTGLLSVRLAGSVKMLEATDFSEEMIRQAKAKIHSVRLHFSVQDATALPYAPETFDAVIISNALHIMPNPEKALSEIRRVLKPDGVLIAPTFTAAGSTLGRLRIRIMELAEFRVFHKWTPEGYLAFLKANGFVIQCSEVLGGPLTLTYAEAKKNNRTEESL